MDPIFVSVLTVLIGVSVRGIAFAELLVRLRWQERQLRADHLHLMELARALPRGCRLDALRADGSELHLVAADAVESVERPAA